MEDCDKTNYLFEGIADRAHDFFDADGWEDTVEANYNKNKALVDQQWEYGLYSWNNGIYFNAGMFYGRVWYYLAYGQWI